MSIDNYTLVVLIDNTLLSDNVILLLRNSLIWCSCTLVVLFFFSIFLAKWIVKPLEDSYEKQKPFISDAGHELKTPLAVVRANTELLERELGDNKWLSNIVFENERMTELVNQLLTLARTSTAHRYGLGLAIAKAVTLSHKGKIRVDCAQGWTTFHVTFPGSK